MRRVLALGWWSLVAAATGACSFSPGALPGDALTSGDDVLVTSADAAIDADLRCTVGGSSTTASGGAIGGSSGGTAQPDITCPAGELPIGLSFGMTQNTLSNHNDQIAAADVNVRCGRVERDASGAMVSTPTSLVSRTGSTGSNCSAYFPRAASAEVTCPAGSVIVGVTGNMLDTTLYNTVTVQCAALTPPATISTTVMAITVTGTGTYTNGPQTAACPAGTGVVTFGARSGCGQDQLALSCSPLTCQ